MHACILTNRLSLELLPPAIIVRVLTAKATLFGKGRQPCAERHAQHQQVTRERLQAEQQLQNQQAKQRQQLKEEAAAVAAHWLRWQQQKAQQQLQQQKAELLAQQQQLL